MGGKLAVRHGNIKRGGRDRVERIRERSGREFLKVGLADGTSVVSMPPNG